MQQQLVLLTLLMVAPTQSSSQSVPPFPSIPPDAVSLLKFKSQADEGNTLLYTLNEPFDYCSWQGVRCHLSRVVRLSLPSHSLRGALSLSLPPHLRVLVLRNNSLSGPLPPSLPPSLRTLDLSLNNFSGDVPPALLLSLSNLTRLSLQLNRFSGPLPPLNQSSLTIFNVSGNNFSGRIPDAPPLSKFPASSFALNPNLCGGPIADSKPCAGNRSSPSLDASSAAATQPSGSSLSPPGDNQRRRHKRKAAVLGASLGAAVLTSSLLCLILATRKQRREKEASAAGDGASAGEPEAIRARLDSQSDELKDKCRELVVDNNNNSSDKTKAKSGNLVFCEGEAGLYSLEQLMRASAEMLGRGTMGTTYKAKLDNQLIVTVKRLDAIRMGGIDGQAFERHMAAVGALRHPNLVPVRAYFQAREERLVIFDYHPNGSVFNLIHGSRSTRAKPLHWTSCLKIAEDVAQGLAYIHQASKLIHGNLKSSNVLLGADFEACITDYCLATLAASSDDEDPDSARYRGPEARKSGLRLTHKCDVYAFGVLLLELLSGKPPSQHPFLAPPDLPDWVQATRRDDVSSEHNRLGLLVEVASLQPDFSRTEAPYVAGIEDDTENKGICRPR